MSVGEFPWLEQLSWEDLITLGDIILWVKDLITLGDVILWVKDLIIIDDVILWVKDLTTIDDVILQAKDLITVGDAILWARRKGAKHTHSFSPDYVCDLTSCLKVLKL